MVNVYAGQLIADGLNQQSSNNRAVNAAGQGQQHLLITDLMTDQIHLIGDEVFHIPVSFSLAGVKHKTADGLFTAFGACGECLAALVVQRPDGETAFINGLRHIDFYAVNTHNNRVVECQEGVLRSHSPCTAVGKGNGEFLLVFTDSVLCTKGRSGVSRNSGSPKLEQEDQCHKKDG